MVSSAARPQESGGARRRPLWREDSCFKDRASLPCTTSRSPGRRGLWQGGRAGGRDCVGGGGREWGSVLNRWGWSVCWPLPCDRTQDSGPPSKPQHVPVLRGCWRHGSLHADARSITACALHIHALLQMFHSTPSSTFTDHPPAPLVPEHSIAPKGKPRPLQQSLPVPPQPRPGPHASASFLCGLACPGPLASMQSDHLWPPGTGLSLNVKLGAQTGEHRAAQRMGRSSEKSAEEGSQ